MKKGISELFNLHNKKNSPKNQSSRRNFLQKAALGGLGMGFLINSNDVAAQIEFATQKVNRSSNPSDLKITDMRIANTVDGPILKLYTNQDIFGLGEVRDLADPRYALMLKSRILGLNPCSVEQTFKAIKQFGGHGRQGGGVSAVEMALWDLAGKAYDVPVYQLLGGKYRDNIRIYADTPSSKDPEVYAQRMKRRMEQGFTFLKMDFGIGLVKDIPGALVGEGFWEGQSEWDQRRLGNLSNTKHPFTRIQITDLGLEKMVEYVHQVREIVGYEIPMSADHFGHFDTNTAIRLGNAVEKYQLAWLEDMVPWFYTEKWKEITHAINTPTLTGEDIFGKEEFRKLCDEHAVDMIQPDLATAGGILETKQIGDYAEEKGVAMALHCAGTPVSFMANVHCAAATQNFIALEHHDVDSDYWETYIKRSEPVLQKGFVKVPEAPGLGVELNEEVVKEHLRRGEEMFAPTEEWNSRDSWDRTWS
ncbi:MAG: mandelate racemase/muconate lactonizing enzyme family protein [Prolixibacteraceae bacterium]|nr:mandelate racemase/muconate lactonizing enzyme family protein [Prolixibacteraceae bacterium]MBN2774804.1 mandelate racemase/muconate lactonizing enzyme family protein [Prolixibacteraceae bacterium]